MAEADRARNIKALVVRPTMDERVGHGFDQNLRNRFLAPVAIDPRNPAHNLCTNLYSFRYPECVCQISPMYFWRGSSEHCLAGLSRDAEARFVALAFSARDHTTSGPGELSR